MAVGLSLLLADQTSGHHPNDHSPYSEQQQQQQQQQQHKIKMNMSSIVRPVIKLSQTRFIKPPSPEVFLELESPYCYLKSCHFCHKKLQPNDDIYMYKGDQGYCTEECRSKQINIDKVNEEKDERQNYMKNLALRRQHRMISHQNSGKCTDTLSVLRDFSGSRRRRPMPLRRNGAIFFC